MFVDRVRVLTRLCVKGKFDVDCVDAMAILFMVRVKLAFFENLLYVPCTQIIVVVPVMKPCTLCKP